MWIRLVDLLRRRQIDAELDAELAHHFEELAAEYRTRGLTPHAAAAAARRDLGSLSHVREAYRDQHGIPAFETLWRNVRFSVRGLRRTPGFTATVVLTLALGAGANIAVFSVIDAVLLRPLPYPDADRLMRLSQVEGVSGETRIAPVRLADWNRLNSTFKAIAGYSTSDAVDTTGDLPERLRQAVVTPRFLDVWGISPALGRGFTDSEHRFGSPVVVMISDRLWHSRGGDRTVLDRPIRSAGMSVSVVGVMPPFLFPERDVDVWAAHPVDAPYAQSRRGGWFVGAVGRLKPDVTIEQARADLNVVQAQLAAQHPDTDRDVRVRIEPFKETMVGGSRGSLWLLYGAVCVLLLIACTNIAGLLLSRAAQREHEVAVRYSLGASRAAVVWQMLTEAAVLAIAGALLGLPLGAAASRALEILAPDLPRIENFALDGRMLLYTIGSVVVLTLLCGLIPAIRSARGAPALLRSGRTVMSPRHSLQWLLVGVQVALSVTLLSGAGLLVRSLEALSRVPAGFDAAKVLTFHVTGRFGEDGGNYDRVVARINRTLDELTAVPGIDAAAVTTMLPGVPGNEQKEFTLSEGAAKAERLVAEQRIVSPSYFATMQIPLLAGEYCGRPADARGSSEVMVNRSFADRYFPGTQIIGRRLAGPGGDRIVGIVGNARELGLDREPVPTVYACFSAPNPSPWFLVRTTGEPLAAAHALRVKIKELEPLRPVYDIAPLEERIGDAYARNRRRTFVLASFAVAALLLACLGVYGTLSYVVSLCRREVGLRLALGASQRAIVLQLLLKAVRVVGLACAAGLVLSIVFRRALSGMLLNVSPSDPATLCAVAVIVTAVAALAALLPALRASNVDPIRALQTE